MENILVSIFSNKKSNIFQNLDISELSDDRIEIIYGNDFNQGIIQSKGKYILFLDHFSTLDFDGLVSFLDELLAINDDIIMGPAFRIDIGNKWNGKLLFRNESERTSLKNNPKLIHDTLLSNKLFNKQFLIKNDIAFVEDNLYNSQLFVSSALLYSKNITVKNKVICYWDPLKRIASLKKEYLSLNNFKQRLAINEIIDQLINDIGNNEIKIEKDKKVLSREILVYLNNVLDKSEEYQTAMFYIVREYITKLSESAFESLDAIDRLKYYLLKNKMFDDLLYVIRFYNQVYIYSAIRMESKVYADFPFFLDETRGIPKGIYDITSELKVRNKVTLLEYQTHNKRLRIEGLSYIDYLNMTTDIEVQKELVFKEITTGTEKSYKLQNKEFSQEEILPYGMGLYYYLNSGYIAEINLNDIAVSLVDEEKQWEIFIKIQVEGIQKERYLCSVSKMKSDNGEIAPLFIKKLSKDPEPIDFFDTYNGFAAIPLVSEISLDEGNLKLSGNSIIEYPNIDEEEKVVRYLQLEDNLSKNQEQIKLISPEKVDDTVIKDSSGLYIQFESNFLVTYQIKNNISAALYKGNLLIRQNENNVTTPLEIISNSPLNELKNGKTLIQYYNKEDGIKLNVIDLNNMKQLNKLQTMVKTLNGKVNTLHSKIKELNSENGSLNQEVKNLNNKNSVLGKDVKILNNKVKYMESSKSWTITKPLRDILNRINNK